MIKKPKISVIMSVFNAEKYLAQAVESILKQTYSNFEFIIFEDASTDDSLQILEQYEASDDRIILVKNKVNHGAEGFIKNLNRGLLQATGEFIARMDADDISDLTRFEKQVTYLVEKSDIFMVGSDLQVIDEAGNKVKIMSAPQDDKDIQKNMLKNISLYHPVIMWRNNRETFYREKMIGCEDYDLYFRLMNSGFKLGNINEPLLQYRILESSISRKVNKLIKWIFVEKARAFFIEQQQNGADSYDDFEPDRFLNILKSDYKNNVQDLLFGAKTASKYQDYDGLAAVLNKAKHCFPNDNRFNIYKLYVKTPKSILPYLLKLNAN